MAMQVQTEVKSEQVYIWHQIRKIIGFYCKPTGYQSGPRQSKIYTRDASVEDRKGSAWCLREIELHLKVYIASNSYMRANIQVILKD